MAAAATAYQRPANDASNFYMNPQTGPSPPETYLYGNNQPQTTTTPANAPDTHTPPSNSVSPTNYHAHANVRHIRQPRQPLYVPAALRPTDPPTRPTDIPARPRAPDTPPSSKGNSLESHGGTPSPLATPSGTRPSGTHRAPSSLDELRRGLTLATPLDLADEPGEVTGPPTSAHWKPDVSARDCAVCHTPFSWFFRRHHCRRCGDVVCDPHSRQVVPLDQNARLHSRGTRSRACDPCAAEWRVVQQVRRRRRASADGAAVVKAAAAESESPGAGSVASVPIPQPARAQDDLRVGSMARSEGGMIWSTF